MVFVFLLLNGGAILATIGLIFLIIATILSVIGPVLEFLLK